MYKVYGRPNCGYCEKAKTLLSIKGLQFTYIDVLEKPENLTEMKRLVPNAKTVPQIFLDDTHIGGFTELEKSLV